VIPPKSNRTATIRYDKKLYCVRNWIERVIGHLKINRAIATRYDQLADSFLERSTSQPLVTGSSLSTRPSKKSLFITFSIKPTIDALPAKRRAAARV
jgi:hypothetical protein